MTKEQLTILKNTLSAFEARANEVDFLSTPGHVTAIGELTDLGGAYIVPTGKSSEIIGSLIQERTTEMNELETALMDILNASSPYQ